MTKILLTLAMFLHFVGDHFYCKTGFTTSTSDVTAWSDPLWDGAGCVADTAHSCDRHGWFHRATEPTQDDIEVIVHIGINGYQISLLKLPVKEEEWNY